MSTRATERGGDRIPIPNFAAAASSPESTASITTSEEESTVVKAAWYKEHLLVAERFLFLQFKKQTSLSFTAFYGVARKIYQQIRRSSTQQQHASKSKKDIEDGADVVEVDKDSKPAAKLPEIPDFLTDLTEEERLLYNLLAATAPTLYRIRRVDEPSLILAGSSKKAIDKKQIWCLESVACRNTNESMNTRQQEFHNLVQQQTISKTKSDAILAAIREHRREYINVQEEPTKTKTAAAAVVASPVARNKPPLEILSETAGTSTVEERVRARAAVQEQEEQQRQQDRNNGSDGSSSARMDSEWLVRLTDALWSQARHQIKSNARTLPVPPSSRELLPSLIHHHPPAAARNEKSNRSSTGCCRMPIKDAVTALRTSLLACTAAGRAGDANSACSKRQIAEALLRLSRDYPEWITLSGDGDIARGDSILRVQTTAVDYAAIRAQLTGTKSPPSHHTKKRSTGSVNSLLLPSQPQPLARKLMSTNYSKVDVKGRKADRALVKEQRAKKVRTVDNSKDVNGKDDSKAAATTKKIEALVVAGGVATKKKTGTKRAADDGDLEGSTTRPQSPRCSKGDNNVVVLRNSNANAIKEADSVRRKSPRLAKKK